MDYLTVCFRSDRVTLKDQEELEAEERRKEKDKRMAAEKRKKQSTKMVADAIAQELQKEQGG